MKSLKNLLKFNKNKAQQLILKVKIERQIKGVIKYSAKAEVDGKIATEAKLMCTIKDI